MACLQITLLGLIYQAIEVGHWMEEKRDNSAWEMQLVLCNFASWFKNLLKNKCLQVFVELNL